MADGGANMATAFRPDAGNTRILRNAFGRFATGVTVITANSDEGPVGITANSFSCLSPDPALVLWSPAKGSRRFPYFEKADHFAIHVLAADQGEICEAFANSAYACQYYYGHMNQHDTPLIDNCLARFECARVAACPGGDHMIMVGQVVAAEMRDGGPLAFYAGKYGKLVAPN